MPGSKFENIPQPKSEGENKEQEMEKKNFLFIEDIWGGGHLSLEFLSKKGKFRWCSVGKEGSSSIAELEPEECKKWLKDDYGLKHTPGKIQEALNFVEDCIH